MPFLGSPSGNDGKAQTQHGQCPPPLDGTKYKLRVARLSDIEAAPSAGESAAAAVLNGVDEVALGYRR